MAPKARRSASKPTRAVIYVRISVDRDDETSTTSQEERCRAYCAAHGLQVVDVIVEPGRSAYKTSRNSRPGFKRAIGLIASGAADVLVCWKIDRLARNTRDTLALVDELAEYGARFVSVTEHFDTSTGPGEMMLTMLAGLAQMESRTKSDRVTQWQEHRRTNGSTPTGPRPFGYKRERNELHIIEREAKVIREAADRVLKKESLRSVTADLERRGVKTGRGTAMTHRGLRAILMSPTIAACRETEPGVFVRSNAWEPILTKAKWEKLRAFLTDPARRTTPGNTRRWLLSGIAACARCLTDDGAPMPMLCKPHAAGPRYFCPQCHLSIEQKRTDEIVEVALLAMLNQKMWRRLRKGRPADSSGFEEAKNELMARWSAGDISGAQLDQLADELERQHQVVATPPPLPNVDDVKRAWPKLKLDQRRLVLSAATESLTIKPWTPTGSFDDTRIVWKPVA